MKKFVLVFFSLSTFLFALFLAETGVRIKYLGMKGAALSYISANSQPSVLGTNDWVVSDPDLNYRLNPKQPEVNQYSMKDKEIIMPKPLGVIRIVVLGDSLPYSGMPNFVDVLKEKFSGTPSIEIINASTPGYTTYQELVFLEKYAIKIDPDLVILSYCLNDNYTFLHRFEKDAKMLLTSEAEISLMAHNSIDSFIQKSYLLTTLKIIKLTQKKNSKIGEFPWENTIDFNTAWKDNSWSDFAERLKKMNTIMHEHSGKLLVVIFPLEMQLDSKLLQSNRQIVMKPQHKVKQYSEAYNISYLDLFQDFFYAKQNGLLLYTDGLHLSAEGIHLTADAIYNFLLHELSFHITNDMYL